MNLMILAAAIFTSFAGANADFNDSRTKVLCESEAHTLAFEAENVRFADGRFFYMGRLTTPDQIVYESKLVIKTTDIGKFQKLLSGGTETHELLLGIYPHVRSSGKFAAELVLTDKEISHSTIYPMLCQEVHSVIGI